MAARHLPLLLAALCASVATLAQVTPNEPFGGRPFGAAPGTPAPAPQTPAAAQQPTQPVIVVQPPVAPVPAPPQQQQAPPAPPPVPAPAPPPAAQAPAPGSNAGRMPVQSGISAPPAMQAPPPVAAPAPAAMTPPFTANARAPAASAAAAQQPVRGLPADAPKVVVSGSVYSHDPARRMLIVNGQIAREGDEVGAGVVVQEVKRDSAVLGYKGQRYTVLF